MLNSLSARGRVYNCLQEGLGRKEEAKRSHLPCSLSFLCSTNIVHVFFLQCEKRKEFSGQLLVIFSSISQQSSSSLSSLSLVSTFMKASAYNIWPFIFPLSSWWTGNHLFLWNCDTKKLKRTSCYIIVKRHIQFYFFISSFLKMCLHGGHAFFHQPN